jgi:hypothetical protein
MTGVEHHEPKSTRRKVICIGPEGVDATEQSQRGRRYVASSAVSKVEDY